MIRALTYDFWQTLYADSVPIEQERVRVRARLIRTLLHERGFEVADADILKGLEQARLRMDQVWRVERRSIEPQRLAEAVLEAVNITSSDSLPDEIAAAMQMAALEVPADRVPQALETLCEISRTIPVALICDTGFSPGRVLREMMRKDGILDCFRHLTFSDEIGTSKPSAANFEVTLQALGVRPEEAAHIGDLIETDIHGAKAAGMKAILFWGEGRMYETTEPADAVIHDHRHLPELLRVL